MTTAGPHATGWPGGSIGSRLGAWRDRTTDDPRHDERTAAVLGLALGVCFTTCFLTGLYSHLAQHPTSWFHLPARPAGLYRVTQGLHVLTGIATIPLLLAKLWSVFPKLLQWPPVTSVAHLLERLSLVPLVAGALFQLWTGLADIDLWYPLPAFFPTVHYWTAWITMGALVVHIGAKITTTRAALARTGAADATPPPADPVARRRFLTAVGATSGLLVVTVAGQTIAPLRRLALLAPRHPDVGVQGFPVNKSAISAGVRHTATSPAYRLQVAGRRHPTPVAHHRSDPGPASAIGHPAHRLRRGVERQPSLDGGAAARPAAAGGGARRLGGHRSFARGARALRPGRRGRGPERRSRHPPGPVGRRPATGPRPRLPDPTHRARPARRHADQVGHPDRGPMTADGEHRTSSVFWAGLVLGWGVMAYGVWGFLHDHRSTVPARTVWWIAGTAVAHDAVVAPVVTLVGLGLAALLPRWARGPVAAAVAASGVVLVFSYPLLRHFGRRADNPSILPLDYPRHVAVVLAVVWAVAGVGLVIRFRRSHRPSPAT